MLLLMFLTLAASTTPSLTEDNDFRFAVLHEVNECPAVTLYALNQPPTTYHFPETTRLFQTCTSQTRLCPDVHLDVIFRGNDRENAVIIAKLVDAIGFMELQNYSGNTEEIKPIIEVLSISQSDDLGPCNPLDVVQIDGMWTIYCIQQSGNIFYCQLEVNFTSYVSSSLRCRFLGNAIVQQPSDFILTPRRDFVYFVDGNVLYRITPANDHLSPFLPLPKNSCSHLDYVRDDLLLYCSSGVSLKIDPSNRAARLQLINETGIAFACHQTDLFYTVKRNPVNTEVHIGNVSVSLNQLSFADTKCVCLGSKPFIIVADAHSDIIILDEDLVNIAQIPAGCSTTNPCRRLLAYADPAGVVVVIFKERGEAEALVFDKTFHLYDKIEISGMFAGVAPLFPPEIADDVTGSTTTEGRNGKSVSFGMPELIGTIISAVALVIAVIAASIIVVFLIRKQNKLRRKNIYRNNSSGSGHQGTHDQPSTVHDGVEHSFNETANTVTAPAGSGQTQELATDPEGQSTSILHSNKDCETTTVPVNAGATPMTSANNHGPYDLSPNTVATEAVNGGAIRNSSLDVI